LTMRTVLVAGEARKAYRSLIDHCGTECVGPVDVCIVGEGFRRECVSECSPQLSASNISGPSLVIDMYPVLGLIEVSIHAHVELNSIADGCEAVNRRPTQWHIARHAQGASARAGREA